MTADPKKIDNNVRFGDNCCFFDQIRKGHLNVPLSSTSNGTSVVQPQAVPSTNFQTCVFQILSYDKYSDIKRLRTKVKSVQRKRKAEDKAEAEKLHRDRWMKGNAKTVKGKGAIQFENVSPSGQVPAMPDMVNKEPDVVDCISDVHSETLKAAAISEARDNDLEQRRHFSMPIHYGQVVQLWHPTSRSFLRVSATANAELEPSSMRVELSPSVDNSAYFRIMPRFKVRSEGDMITAEDEVVFESVRSKGQYLNSTDNKLNFTDSVEFTKRNQFPINHCHEVCASVSKGSFKIEQFSRPLEYIPLQYSSPFEKFVGSSVRMPPLQSKNEKNLNAGDVFQLIHKDTDAYMASEGSAPNDFDVNQLPPHVNLHMRVRQADVERPNRLLPPTSAVTFFQVEKDELSNGGPIEWGEPIRIKHVPTQLYLSFDGNTDSRSVTLVSLSGMGDEKTLFSMIQQGSASHGLDRFVDRDAFVKLKHVVHQMYVHPTRNTLTRRDSKLIDASSDFTTALESMVWDNASLNSIEMIEDEKFDDVFSMMPVDENLAFAVHHILGFLPLLNRYTEIRSKRELTKIEAMTIAKELNELDDFMYVKGIPQKARQKQLRSLCVIDALIAMLKAPFNKAGNADVVPSFDDITKHPQSYLVSVNVFRLLQTFLRGDSRKNELYMCRHASFLWSLYGSEMKVEPMFNELVRDNIKVIQHVTHIEIKRIIALMQKDKNADYLEFLSVLCVCEDDPYRAHQAAIGQILLVESDPPPVYLTNVRTDEDGGKRFVTVTTSRIENDEKPLSEFVKSALDEDDDTSSAEYLFLQRQLELFGNLCLGRMAANIKLLTIERRYLTWDECYICVQMPSETQETKGDRNEDQKLPRSLRRIYVDLITNLFVNVDPNRDVLSRVDLNYPWDEVDRDHYTKAAADPIQALSGAEFIHFPVIKQWLFDEMSRTESMVHEDRYMGIPQNKLLASMLNLLQHLIKYGYYAEGKDIEELMEPLEGVISGMNDKRRVDGFHQETDDDEGPKSDGDDATTAKEINDQWLGEGRYQEDIYGLTVMKTKFQALKCVESLFNHAFNVKLRFLLADFKMASDDSSINRKKSSRRTAPSFKKVAAFDVGTQNEHTMHTFHTLLDEVKQEQETGKRLSSKTVKDVRKYLANLAADCNWVMERCDPGWTIVDSHISSKKGDEYNPTLVEVLLDCSNYEGYYPLLSLSMQLVARIYMGNRNLYTKAVQATIMISEPSVKLGKRLNEDVPQLTRESGGVISGNSIDTCVKLLRYYTACCYIKSHRETKDKDSIVFNSDDPGPRHQINQQLLHNTGILPIIIDVVKTDDQDPLILSAAFEFLRGMAAGFKEVQERLNQSLDVLLLTETLQLDDPKAEQQYHLKTWKVALGALVTEIFNGCKETCISVRPDQVESILTLLGEYTTDAPTFLDALEAINMVEEYNIPLKKNQELTITNLMLHKKKLVDVAYIDDQSSEVINRHRLTLLAKCTDQHGVHNPLLRHYHLSLVKLLSSTCEGENQQIEATCRSIFTLSELQITLSHTGIDYHAKTPYIKFLLWVYLNAAASPAETGTDVIERDRECVLLETFVTLASNLAECYKDEAHSRPEHAAFSFDAFLPCLSQLLSGHFPSEQGNLDRANEAVISIGKHLNVFLNNVFKSDIAKIHMNKFRVMSVVSFIEDIKARLDSKWKAVNPGYIREIEALNARVSSHGLNQEISDATDAQYQKTYSKEISKNVHFNKFAILLGKYYCGPNTIEKQMAPIRSSFPSTAAIKTHDKDDPTSTMYTEDAGADEALPLGPEFQYYSRIICKKDPETYGKSHTEVEDEIIKSMVRLWTGALKFQAMADTSDRDENETVIVVAMQALRAVCVNEVHMGGQLSQLQSQLVKAKVVLPIAMLLGSANKVVQQEVLAITTKLLEDGYAESQKAFARYFLGTREETFFDDITGLIQTASSSFKEHRLLLKQREASENARNKIRETMKTTVQKSTGKQIQELMAEMPTNKEEISNPTFVGTGGDANDDLGDVGNIRLVFRVLQSLCEGHNTILQNYLREQPDNGKSFNLVVFVAEFLPILTEEFLINRDGKGGKRAAKSSVDILVQCLETLVEFSQGNRDNQRAIFNARSVDSINELLRKTNESSGFLDKDIAQFKPYQLQLLLDSTSDQAKLDLTCAQLVASQLATNDSDTVVLAKEIGLALDVRVVMGKMREYSVVHAKSKGGMYEDDMTPREVAFSFYEVLARLTDVTGVEHHKDRAITRRDKKFRKRHNLGKKFSIENRINDFGKKTGVIEVLMDGTLQKVHFPVEKHWEDQLRAEVREDLLWAVDRSSTADGVRDFADRCKTLIADMKYIDDVQNFSIVTRKLLEWKPYTNKLVIFASYLINLFMIISFEAPINDYRTIVPAYRDIGSEALHFKLGGENVFTVLASIHVFLSFLIVFTYFLANPPSFRALVNQLLGMVASEDFMTAREKKFVEVATGEHSKKDDDDSDSDDDDEKEESDSDSDSESEDEDAADELEAQDEEFHEQAVISQIVDNRLISREAFRTQTSILSTLGLYHILFLFMSLLGLFNYGYFFCFHLFHIIIGNKNMQNVIQSVVKNGRTLISVLVLIMLLIYVYAVLIFAMFRKDIDNLENMYCDDLLECTITSLRYGLMSGGGLGEAIPTLTNGAGFYNEPAFKFFILDISFFIIITTIGLNVVFGVIVDTFSELRDEKYRTEELMNSQCFICGRGTYDFERYGKGFRHHVKNEHRMWNYLMFFRHLDEMDPTAYNAIEQHVARKFYEETYDFFPVNRALCLDDIVGEDEERCKEDMILEKVTDIKSDMQTLIRASENQSDGFAAVSGGGPDDTRPRSATGISRSRFTTRRRTDDYLEIDNVTDFLKEEESPKKAEEGIGGQLDLDELDMDDDFDD